MVLPPLRLHDARGDLEALRRDSDAVPEATDIGGFGKAKWIISRKVKCTFSR